jgi:CTP:phosphocholine cytidylyltransferase-like protein
MAKRKPDSYHAAKKKVKMEKLVEKYYGKKDLLAAWDDHPNPDLDYIRDLKARLRTHKNDLIYRGRDVEENLAVL